MRRTKHQQGNAAATAGGTSKDAAEAFRTAVVFLKGLDPAVLQAVLVAARTNNQICAAATSTTTAMVGVGSPPTGEGSIVTPGVPSLSLLNPKEMKELMTGDATTPSGPSDAAKSAVAPTR